MGDHRSPVAVLREAHEALGAVAASRSIRLALGVAFFVVATAVGARIAVPVPLSPVPMTLQPLLVILAGAFLGAWGGAGAMAVYLAIGAAGAPIFATGGAGVPWLMGPTGGYLLAYPAAAFTTGLVVGGRTRGPVGIPRALVAFVAGFALIYAGGASQLWILTRQDLQTIFAQAVAPFLVGDVLKVLIATVVVTQFRPSGDGPDRGRD